MVTVRNRFVTDYPLVTQLVPPVTSRVQVAASVVPTAARGLGLGSPLGRLRVGIPTPNANQ